jgi:hypothetical protein
MKKFAAKLDEPTVRRGFPIADIVEGWFFRSREVSAGVYEVDGTDVWGQTVHATGSDPERLLRECAENARRIEHHVGDMLFYEYGTALREQENELVLNVLCGRVGQFGVEFPLTDSERQRYKREGDSFIQELADAVRRNPDAYKHRTRRG